MADLNLVTEYARGTPEAAALQGWADSISTLTGSTHSVRVFYGGELVPAFETLDAVTSGMVDMAWMAPSYYPSHLPTLGALSAPLLAGAGPETSEALFDVLPQGAFDPHGLRLLAAAYTDPIVLLTSASGTVSPGDLSGTKIYNGFGGPGAALLTEAGAVSLSLPGAELYPALQTGVIDGALVAASFAARLNLEEVSGTQMVFPQAQALFTQTRSLVINEAAFQALPADLRNVLETSTGAGLSRQMGEAALIQYQAALAEFSAAGGLNEVGGADLTAWQALAARQTQALLNTLGPEARALHGAMEQALAPELPGIAIGSDFGTGAPFAFLVATDLGISSATELDGATVALLTGSDQEQAVDAYFRANNMIYAPVPVLTPGEAIAQFRAGAADILVVPASWVTPGALPPRYEVLPEQAGAAPGPTSGDDTLSGTPGDDVIALLEGNDVYHALAGNDSVAGNQGNDRLFGGDGFDTLDGGNGNDTVFGGNGRDMVFMGVGNDIFYDNAQGGSLGQDTVFAHAGDDTIEGGNGNDHFHGMTGNDLIFARLGDDLILGGDGFDTLLGGAGNDKVYAGNGRDMVYLGAGDDKFFDTAQGGTLGRDTVFAGTGNDTIQGGNGDDEFHGMAGNDLIFARLGDDLIFGGDGFDRLEGGAGNDSVHGGNGRDLAFLGTGDDVFFDNGQGGVLGQDTVFAGAGNDTIQGGNGNDVFRGEWGDDLIFARLGDDVLDGGAGNDTLDGGAGADVFVFAAGSGDDLVNGYEVGVDTLQLDAALWSGTLSEAQVVAQFASVVGGNVIFDFGAEEFTLMGINSTAGLENDLLII